MKKIFLIVILFCLNINIKALEDIKIDNENLSPFFDKDIYNYNYFTDKDKIKIEVVKDNNEIVSGYGVFTLEKDEQEFIVKSDTKIYKIRVYKNYKNTNNTKKNFGLLDLVIEGYDIKFNPKIHQYNININNEDNLNIKYELENDNTYISIEGNGNFNKTKNIITINVDNKEKYIINVYKTLNVSYIEPEKEIKQMTYTKKEIVKIILIAISSLIVYLFYKFLFKINVGTLQRILHK